MTNLDILSLPLNGTRLIEAAAGTGKTYIITIIYIRLLLHLGGHTAFSRPLTIEEILVVTFTKSAIQTLLNKIRDNIHNFRLDCMRKNSSNNLFSQLLLQIKDINLAVNQLLIAEKKIDQASIFTIHGFCQKILTQNTIELNTLFHTSIIENEITLYKKICTDFWRRNFYEIPLNIATLIQSYWKNPEALLKDTLPYIYNIKINDVHHINNHSNKKNINIFIYYSKIISCIHNIKEAWSKNKNKIYEIIYSYDINQKIYNNKNLTRWINNINKWVQKTTTDHTVPEELKYFRLSIFLDKLKNNKPKEVHTSSLFNIIEELYQKLLLFKPLLLNNVLNEFNIALNNHKNINTEITFNDLINLLVNNFTKNTKSQIIDNIRTSYPITIIDEFQDTDQQQYKIFNELYYNNPKYGLILVGDPKQAIYGFRGADIFTYTHVRKKTYNKYNLNINWRSSSNMVNAVNQLFNNVNNPFIFKEIPFIPSIAAHKEQTYQFTIENKPQTAMHFWLYSHEYISKDYYNQVMAYKCATTVQNLLYKIHNKTAWLKNNSHKKILQLSDITILVRNHKEASLMRSILLKFNIPAILLSNQENIFTTIEAHDLLLLLKAILYPKKDMINAALTTVFFKLNSAEIENINNNTYKLEQIIIEFSEYYLIWKEQNVSLMIQKIIFQYKIPVKLLSIQTGEESLINILHLSELLQNISEQLHSQSELVWWLFTKIKQSQEFHQCISSDQLLRLKDNDQSVKISTIHKSKGLEFPIVFLPFISNFSYKKNNTFNHRILIEKYLNLDLLQSNTQLSEKEWQLSEDLRLLYVAITRSIYQCSIGILDAKIIYKNQKNCKCKSSEYLSALRYLMQNEKTSKFIDLTKILTKLQVYSKGDIDFESIKSKENIISQPIATQIQIKKLSVSKNNLTTNKNSCTITSYSMLKRNNNILSELNVQKELQLHFNLNNIFHKKKINLQELTSHTFPKGKMYGEFFHNIFEIIDFEKPINTNWLRTEMAKYNIDSIWTSIIRQWLFNIFNTPLNKNNLTLAQITSKNKKTEFKFYLHINDYLDSKKLNDLCKKYDFLSSRSSNLIFETVKGMLQGFIDLIFRWKDKYYLLDYKSNWLGENNSFYTQSELEKEMIKFRYDLQYQLYTLALHRFLRHKIIHYHYEKNFGGIYYLFIRGINNTQSNNGIYFCYPPLKFINKLDNLFSAIQ